VTRGDLGGFRVFVRDLDQFLAPLLVELGDAQAQHLAFGRGRQAEIGIHDRLLYRLDHRLVPDLHRDQARLRHADGGELVERHVAAVGVDLHRIEHRGGGAPRPQAAELVLERGDGALHAALHFVEVEITRGHHVSPSKSRRPPGALPEGRTR